MSNIVSPSAASTNAKRKATVASLTANGRSVKRRALRACHCCRSRKVRCDVVESGTPCTNCRLDEVECVVSGSKRKKKPRADGDLANQSPLSSNEELEERPSLPSYEDIDVQDALDGLLTTAPPQPLAFETSRHVPHMIYQTQGHRLTKDERVGRMSSISQTSPTLTSPMSVVSMPQTRLATPLRLPRYIRPLPARIMTEDMEYLASKGALTVPETRLRNELLRTYVQYVHPFMPLLDLKEFLWPLEKNDGSAHVSLLLLQAVMFAATAFVDMRFLNMQGFDNRKGARKLFFQRARLLYDFDYETDRIALVQALLLMTYWYETPDDQKDTWHWMGVSLSLAHTIGLHRNPENSNMDPYRQRLWKRIWWSCFMRDRLIALGMRRPMRIKNEDCDVPMLILEDFDVEPLPPELVRMLGGCPAIRDKAKRTKLARLCIEKAKLCLCISHILAAQYSVLSHKFGGTTEATMMLVPKKSAAESLDVITCDRELDEWLSALPEDCRYHLPGSPERAIGHDGEVLEVHRALLSMIYLTTSSALHRPQVLPASPQRVLPAELQELSRRKVGEAAAEITDISRALQEQDLIRFLPTTSVTILLPTIIIHLWDIKSSDSSVRNSSLRRLDQCMQVLQRLREIYASADFAFSFLEAAIRKANIDMPLEIVAAKLRRFKTEERRPQFSGSSASHHHAVLTPPPDTYTQQLLAIDLMDVEGKRGFYAPTPPRSDGSTHSAIHGGAAAVLTDAISADQDIELMKSDFDALINFDAGADLFAAEDGVGVDLDMDWMAGMPDGLSQANGAGFRDAITSDLDGT